MNAPSFHSCAHADSKVERVVLNALLRLRSPKQATPGLRMRANSVVTSVSE